MTKIPRMMDLTDGDIAANTITSVLEYHTEVQAISFVYFTSRGATLVWGKWANWVAMIPIPLPLYPICYITPC